MLVAAGLAWFLSGVSAQTTLPEVQVSTAAIPDYEFDSARLGVFCPTCNFGFGNARFAFSDAAGKLWVGSVDFQTGAFYPPDGHGVLVDTGTATATEFGNGPEWMSSTAGSRLVYTKYAPGQTPSPATASIALATMVNGSWSPSFFSNGLGRVSPAATLDATDTAPRVNYTTSDKTRLYWRSMSNPTVENVLPINELTDGNSRRWVAGTRKVIFQGHDPKDPRLVDQVFLYDTDTGLPAEKLTSEPNGVVGAFMWRAPEFNNEYVFFTMAKFRAQLLVYRKLLGNDGVARWTVVKTINAPTALPFFWSPEPFVHNGRSYIFTQLSPSSRFFDLSIPTHIAITGIDPLRQDFRMLTNDTTRPRVRLDPEFFITAKGPYIYYNRAVPETTSNPAINDGVWRVDTKLGPPLPAPTLGAP